MKAEPAWATDPAENKNFFFAFFFFFFTPLPPFPRISVQLDRFPDPLHLAAAQMLVLAAGGGREGWERMARAQRSQLLLEALAAAAEHKRLFFFFFSGLGFLSKLGRAEGVSAQTANNPRFAKQELKVQRDPAAGHRPGCASPAPRGRGQERQDQGRFVVSGPLQSTLTAHSSVGSELGDPAAQTPRQHQCKRTNEGHLL